MTTSNRSRRGLILGYIVIALLILLGNNAVNSWAHQQEMKVLCVKK